MPKIKLTLPDGSVKEVEMGTTGLAIAESIGERLAKAAVAVKIGEQAIDLDHPLMEDAPFQILTFADQEGKEVFWHSAAHLMAAAIVELFPESKLTIGPAIDAGFYYDIERKDPFSPDDFPKIEAKMHELVKADHPSVRKEISKEDALNIYKDNKFKQELINEMEGSISIYHSGSFSDICCGPHVPSWGRIKSFKLLRVSGAYWRADQKREQLQRIYGIAFPDKKLLKEYLKQREEAEKRDHKKLAKELDLFMQSDFIGKGLPIWLPKGEIIRREIENFAVETERLAGYQRVSTPNLAKKELYLTSGHLPFFQDDMYPEMKLDDGTYYLKPMNCPHHHLVFKHKPRSYRELPLRIAEYGTCFRNELSGTLVGLLRVRTFSMNDAHIYCTHDQIEKEFKAVITMIVDYFKVFGLTDYHFRLSLGDPANTEKYVDEPDNWAFAEDLLRKILTQLKVPFVEAKNEATFYGPKVDIQYKAVTGREETMSTVQLDFAAKTKFDFTYIDHDGKENNEVYVIHRAPLSTHERFLAFLIEHYAGKFPLWLNPEQVRILTVSDKFLDHARKVNDLFFKAGIRSHVDDRSESIPFKVREAQLSKVNYILVVGEREVNDNTVTVRTRNNEVVGAKNVDAFLEELKKEIAEKR
ncbi:MAG: threonine--tRNA ligase [Nanoarchaeota archaeon]